VYVLINDIGGERAMSSDI